MEKQGDNGKITKLLERLPPAPETANWGIVWCQKRGDEEEEAQPTNQQFNIEKLEKHNSQILRFSDIKYQMQQAITKGGYPHISAVFEQPAAYGFAQFPTL